MRELLLFLIFTLALQAQSKEVNRPKKITSSSQVKISWKYENFPLKIEIADIQDEKKKFISETKSFQKQEESITTTIFPESTLTVPLRSATPFALLIKNPGPKDYYFFAVPHELNPHQASAGHYFECLCIGKVFKVPAHSTWYRIVRLNLNESFQNIKNFEINHQIIGLEKSEVLRNYKDRLYEQD